ncbi:hypothetical protein GWJ21_16490, partial [Bacillus coagulans]|nr:hypothetical protein [Heyndrickxia coagulans]
NEEFKKISSTETAKEAWTILQTTYEGTKAVKDSKLQRLTTSFEEIKMEEDESFDEFYAKLKDIVNSAFNLGETIPEPKVVRKVLRSLPERFHAKITAIEESKDIDKIPLTELVGNLQTYELGLSRIGKSSKGKSMALKAKSSDTDESSDDEDSKMKSYITRQFKKFMKNANGRSFDKDRRQSSSSQFKSQDKGRKDAKDGGQYTVPAGPKCFGCHGFGHMKNECPTYLKSIGKSKALAATLSDTEPEDDSDNEDDGILNAFTASVNSTEGIVEEEEEEELVDTECEKMDDKDDIHSAYEKLYKLSEKHEKLYRLATKKLSEVELDREELSTKFDEANQTIGALRFENNFLAEKTKKLEAELFQVRAQLERTSSAKLDEMLSNQKSASDRTGLGYGLSFSNSASTSSTVFVPPADTVKIENIDVKTELASENVDKGKSILGAPPKLEKKGAKLPKDKKANSQKPKQKKQHLCYHCGAAGHTRPNCYKWLATQKSNSMTASGSQNQLQSSLAPLGDLLKALMFLSNLNGCNPSPSPPFQSLNQRKGSSKAWKKKDSK